MRSGARRLTSNVSRPRGGRASVAPATRSAARGGAPLRAAGHRRDGRALRIRWPRRSTAFPAPPRRVGAAGGRLGARRPRSAVSCAARRSRPTTATCSTSTGASCSARVARARCCLTAARPRTAGCGRWATADCSLTASSSATPCGRSCACRSTSRFFFDNAHLPSASRRSIPIPRARRVQLGLEAWRDLAGRQSDHRDALPRRRGAASSTAHAARDVAGWSRSMALLRAGGADPHTLDRADRWQGGVAGDRHVLRRPRPALAAGRKEIPATKIRRGTPSTKADAPTHTPGIKQGNSIGDYEKQRGHLPDGRSTARRSTGIRSKSSGPIDPSMPNLSPA